MTAISLWDTILSRLGLLMEKKTHREYQVAYVCYQALPIVKIHHCRVSSTPRDVPEHLDKCNFGTNPAQDRASVCSQNCFENFIFYFFTTAWASISNGWIPWYQVHHPVGGNTNSYSRSENAFTRSLLKYRFSWTRLDAPNVNINAFQTILCDFQKKTIPR